MFRKRERERERERERSTMPGRLRVPILSRSCFFSTVTTRSLAEGERESAPRERERERERTGERERERARARVAKQRERGLWCPVLGRERVARKRESVAHERACGAKERERVGRKRVCGARNVSRRVCARAASWRGRVYLRELHDGHHSICFGYGGLRALVVHKNLL